MKLRTVKGIIGASVFIGLIEGVIGVFAYSFGVQYGFWPGVAALFGFPVVILALMLCCSWIADLLIDLGA